MEDPPHGQNIESNPALLIFQMNGLGSYDPAGLVFAGSALGSAVATPVIVSGVGPVLLAFNRASFSTSAPLRISSESLSASCNEGGENRMSAIKERQSSGTKKVDLPRGKQKLGFIQTTT